jgi:hypothetical protein
MVLHIFMKINVLKSEYTEHLKLLSPVRQELMSVHYIEVTGDINLICSVDYGSRGLPFSVCSLFPVNNVNQPKVLIPNKGSPLQHSCEHIGQMTGQPT